MISSRSDWIWSFNYATVLSVDLGEKFQIDLSKVMVPPDRTMLRSGKLSSKTPEDSNKDSVFYTLNGAPPGAELSLSGVGTEDSTSEALTLKGVYLCLFFVYEWKSE